MTYIVIIRWITFCFWDKYFKWSWDSCDSIKRF